MKKKESISPFLFLEKSTEIEKKDWTNPVTNFVKKWIKIDKKKMDWQLSISLENEQNLQIKDEHI